MKHAHMNVSNVTLATEADNSDVIWAWVFLPIFISALFYCSLVLFTWPYARPIIPFWLLIFAVLIPPFFPFLAVYILFLVCIATPPIASSSESSTVRQGNVIVVINPSRRGTLGVVPVVPAKDDKKTAVTQTRGNRV